MGDQENGGFVELEFSFADDAYPAVRISRTLDCRLDLLEALQADDGTTTAFFRVEEGDPEAVVEQGRASALTEEVNTVTRFDDECAVEIVLSQSLFATFADANVPMQSLIVRDGVARVLATVPPTRTATAVIERVTSRHPSVEFVGKRRTAIATPFVTKTAFQTVLNQHLTGRQLDALKFAFEYGYFERPRRTTQQELAERMGISPSTFGQHLHSSLLKLLSTLFTDGQTRDILQDWERE